MAKRMTEKERSEVEFKALLMERIALVFIAAITASIWWPCAAHTVATCPSTDDLHTWSFISLVLFTYTIMPAFYVFRWFYSAEMSPWVGRILFILERLLVVVMPAAVPRGSIFVNPTFLMYFLSLIVTGAYFLCCLDRFLFFVDSNSFCSDETGINSAKREEVEEKDHDNGKDHEEEKEEEEVHPSDDEFKEEEEEEEEEEEVHTSHNEFKEVVWVEEVHPSNDEFKEEEKEEEVHTSDSEFKEVVWVEEVHPSNDEFKEEEKEEEVHTSDNEFKVVVWVEEVHPSNEEEDDESTISEWLSKKTNKECSKCEAMLGEWHLAFEKMEKLATMFKEDAMMEAKKRQQQLEEFYKKEISELDQEIQALNQEREELLDTIEELTKSEEEARDLYEKEKKEREQEKLSSAIKEAENFRQQLLVEHYRGFAWNGHC